MASRVLAEHTNIFEPVVVDSEACLKLAKIIASQAIPLDQEDTPIQGFEPKQLANFYFLLVAICHQTSPRGKLALEGRIGEKYLRGWDYLSAKLETHARKDPHILFPNYWVNISAITVAQIFRDEEVGDRLSDTEGRALLIRDLGAKMLKNNWQWVDQIYEASHHSIDTDNSGLICRLADFRAYDDPVHKKSFLFLALMQNTGLWVYADPERLGAPVDYHEVRGHLRIGTVQICDSDLRNKLIHGFEVSKEEDIKIRHAVYKALLLVSEYSGLRNPSQLHYLFWNVFRSCCTRENPHCKKCPTTCSLPSRYIPLALFADGTKHCPFSAVCQSNNQELKMLDHFVDTDYY